MCTRDKVESAFQSFLQGQSLRSLAKFYGIPKSTLSLKFRSTYGEDYAQLKNQYGILPIVNEYLKSPQISPKHKEQIREWLSSKEVKITISKSDSKYLGNRLLTDKKIESLTR